MTDSIEAIGVIEAARRLPGAIDAAVHGGFDEGVRLGALVNDLRSALERYDRRGSTDRDALRERLGVEPDEQGRVSVAGEEREMRPNDAAAVEDLERLERSRRARREL